MGPEILVPLILGSLGIMIVLIPVAGFTARFALKPIMEAIARGRELQGRSADEVRQIAMLDQRIALIEQQLQGLETSVQRIEEGVSFERQLHPGTGGGSE